MRGSRWWAFLLALLVGPGSSAVEIDPGELEEPRRERARGHAVDGVSFYVWEENRQEAQAWAAELGSVERISPLGSRLCRMAPLDRTFLVASLATSTEERTRRTLARALSAPFEAVGIRGALDHLQRDPSAEVRRLARVAAATRGHPLADAEPLSSRAP